MQCVRGEAGECESIGVELLGVRARDFSRHWRVNEHSTGLRVHFLPDWSENEQMPGQPVRGEQATAVRAGSRLASWHA